MKRPSVSFNTVMRSTSRSPCLKSLMLMVSEVSISSTMSRPSGGGLIQSPTSRGCASASTSRAKASPRSTTGQRRLGAGSRATAASGSAGWLNTSAGASACARRQATQTQPASSNNSNNQSGCASSSMTVPLARALTQSCQFLEAVGFRRSKTQLLQSLGPG